MVFTHHVVTTRYHNYFFLNYITSYLTNDVYIVKIKKTTYCFDALMKDRFMNKIKLAKFSNEFDVSQHLDLSNSSLFLLLWEEGAILLIID